MFWKKWFQRRPMASEAQLRFMFRLGKESAQQQQINPYAPARSALPSCPIHHSQLSQAQRPEQGGYWMFCVQCQQVAAQSDTSWLLAQRAGTRLHTYNAQQRATEKLQHTGEQPPLVALEDAFLNDIVDNTPTLLTPIITKKDRRRA